MKLVRWSTLAAVILAMSVYVSPVYADSIGPEGCSGSGCFGGVWTLEYELASGTTYNIFYTVDTSGMGSSGFGDIAQIGFKVSSSVVSATLLAANAPTGWGTNAQINTGLDAGGCSGGGNGFVCSDGLIDLPVGTLTYTWEFQVDIGAATLLTGDLATCGVDQDCASIKANGTAAGNVLSQNITLQPREGLPLVVPEPTTFLLVGSVLGGFGLLWGRKQWLGRRAA